MPFVAYFLVLVLTAVTAAAGLDYLTSPDLAAHKHEIGSKSAANAVRQVPIGKTTHETAAQVAADNKDLTPIYPAAPGKDLPPPQVADAGATPPAGKTSQDTAAPAQPTGTAIRPGVPATPVAHTATSGQPAGACAIAACASAYRSFRASDCTYLPYDGPRKACDLTADGAQQAFNSAPAATMRSGSADPDEFADVVRTVRHLPPPQAVYGDDDGFDDGGRIVVMQHDGARPAYGPRYIYEER
ncbi:MAG: BA14K family protein [Proteobacteria bacterium]|nr:BA14K family protein [Pseudomonadota bacterium]